jgi:hypothetical protein
VLKVLKVYKVL